MFLKKVFLGVSLALTCVLGGFMLYQEQRCVMAVPMLNEQETAKICEQRRKENIEYELYFEGTTLPVYAEGEERAYLISQTADDWRGDIEVSGEYQIAFSDKEKFPELDECIQNAQALEYIVYNDESYQKGRIYVTGLPVMLLEDEAEQTEAERTYGNMVLFNTAKERGDYKTVSRCEYHVRGSASRVYYKQGYKLNLLDTSGNSNKQQLLDLRKDDDWILRAMGLDESKIREQLATEIWNAINSFGTYQGRYIELFQDGAYRGLYLLHEPMDFKTVGLDTEKHFLVQVKTWPDDSDFWSDVERWGGMKSLQCGEFIVDRKNENDLDEVYEVLKAYREFMDGREPESVLNLNFDLEGLYKMDIFLMLITGVDNSAKNQYMIFTRETDGSYTVQKLPWDMDASFGQNLDYCVYEGFDSLYTGDQTVERLKEVWPEETVKGLKETYMQLRSTVLTEEYLQELIEQLYGTLEYNRVLERENATWDKAIGREQTEFVKAFVERRLQWMDSYYCGL